MKVKEIHIQNYKSLVDLKIVEPNPFTVFVGPNGAGKSNIFEALEFLIFGLSIEFTLLNRMYDHILNFNSKSNVITINFIEIEGHGLSFQFSLDDDRTSFRKIHLGSIGNPVEFNNNKEADFKGFAYIKDNFTKIFCGKSNSDKKLFNGDWKLNTDCSNLEKVLKRILKDETKREEIIEWLDLLVPGFENIEIRSEELSGTDALLIYEKGTKKPFNKNLISDGTYNILSLLTAVYQSDEPQFLCIEEPENGLNPKVQKELVNLFRQKCEEEGHYIWLNTHSQTIVNQLTPNEIILVDKKDGETQIKQLSEFNLHGLQMDEAWLSNALGGGIPW